MIVTQSSVHAVDNTMEIKLCGSLRRNRHTKVTLNSVDVSMRNYRSKMRYALVIQEFTA